MAKLMHKLFGIVALSSLAAVPFVMGAGQSGEAASRGAKFSEFVKPTAENGANAQPSSKPHRVNIIGRFDAKTLKEIAPRAEFDYGHNTFYGFQDIVFDGKRLIASFYAVKGSPDTVFFDKDLNILGTAFANCSQGFDILPPSLRRDGPRFVRAKTKNGKTGVSCSFDFIDLDKEKTCQVK